MSYRKIKNKLSESGFKKSIGNISNVINQKGKRREARMKGEEFKYKRQSKVLTSEVLKMIKQKVDCENPVTQEDIAQVARISLSIVNRAIHKNLKLKTRNKTTVHVLNTKDIKNRKRNSRKLYEQALSGKKSNL